MMNLFCIISILYFAAPVSVVCADSDVRTGVRGAATANVNHTLGRQIQSKSIGFKLRDASTGQVINNLENGDVVNIGNDSPTKMTIEVAVTGYNIASVKITLSGATYIQKVETGTYALCGNMGSKFFPCPDLKLGKNKVKAELYTGSGATGTTVESKDVDFALLGKIQVPVAVPVMAPVMAPMMAPVASPGSCSVPKLVGSWEKWTPYPLNVAESMGGMVGDDFVIFSGFEDEWTEVTKSVYAYNVKDLNAKWKKMDDVPVPGFTHAAFAINGKVVYICGAYVGGTPGPDSKICLKYDHAASSGSKWSFLPQLPDGRGGAGMNHIKETNSLVFSIGSTRRNGQTQDHTTTWELELNSQSGWVKRNDCLYTGNHVSHVTAYYKDKPRYYWAGGQHEQEEEDGNKNDLVEWDQASKTWIKRANMKTSRGHASSSTIAYGCGFLMIGGAVNGGKRTTDISWYSIEKDSWTKIGDLKNSINTPVCDIVQNLNGSDWIYCQSGLTGSKYSWKSKITL